MNTLLLVAATLTTVFSVGAAILGVRKIREKRMLAPYLRMPVIRYDEPKGSERRPGAVVSR